MNGCYHAISPTIVLQKGYNIYIREENTPEGGVYFVFYVFVLYFVLYLYFLAPATRDSCGGRKRDGAVPPSGARHRMGGGGGAASIRGLHFERPGAGGGARDEPHETEPETHMWTLIVIVLADSSSSLRLRLRL
jgi:hypothetical protein